MKTNGQSPLKQGDIRDIVKPTRPRHIRKKEYDSSGRAKTQRELMKIDLIRALAFIGIEISNVPTLAKKLVDEGWTKTEHIKHP